MRILRITIKKYKNLEDFDCIFSDSNIAAFIGNNGSGKSNLLEAITAAFSLAKNVSAKKNPNIILYPELYDCKIQYECDGMIYVLSCSNSEVSISHNDLILNKLGMEAALPETIMLYYAGETNRQAITAQNTFDEAYTNLLKRTDNSGFPGYKFLDMYSQDDLAMLLMTAAVYKGEYYGKLLNLLNCKDIVPDVSITLSNPKRSRGQADTYWGAKGFVKSFLDELRRYVSTTDDLSLMYLMNFKDICGLKETSTDEGELFAKLKALKNSGYLYRLSFNLQRQDDTVFSYEDLSEGEKQLSLLLLLLSFTNQRKCLYLFDEFDAYLHLNWQKEFGKMLNEIDVNGHILFTTHSPATISGMKRNNVYIMTNGKVSPAPSETYNRSLDEIMEEHMLVSMRPKEYNDLVQEFRNAVVHDRKDLAEEALIKLREIVGETDPFFITARIAMNRMEK